MSSHDKYLKITRSVRIPLDEFAWAFSRSGGPGGQNVNKVNTRVQLRWPLDRTDALSEAVMERFRKRHRRRINKEGELLITSQRFRDQLKNRHDCLERLTALVEEVLTVPPPRRPTRVSRGAKERRIKAKKERSETKRLRKPPPAD